MADSRIGEALAQQEDAVKRRAIESLQGRIAVANGMIAYASYQETVAGKRWSALAAAGATSQRVLWASTSTKNPDYPKLKYVEELIGEDTVNTIPAATFDAYREEGHPTPALQTDWKAKLDEAREIMTALENLGISMDRITDELLVDGVRQFSEAFGVLLASVESKRDAIVGN